jgi:RNA polymerase sigma factor (sigma-70 family)
MTEIELLDDIRRAQDGDAEALERLTLEHMEHIERACRWATFRFPRHKDWQECLADAWQAFRTLTLQYRGDNGASFATWIDTYLRMRMIDALRRDNDAVIHFPSRTKLTPLHVVSLNEPIRNDDGRRPIERLASVADDRQPRPDAEKGLNGFTSGLSQRERLILLLHYVEGQTMKEVGQSLGFHESRVSQIHSRTIARLRQRVDRQQHLSTTQDKGD